MPLKKYPNDIPIVQHFRRRIHDHVSKGPEVTRAVLARERNALEQSLQSLSHEHHNGVWRNGTVVDGDNAPGFVEHLRRAARSPGQDGERAHVHVGIGNGYRLVRIEELVGVFERGVMHRVTENARLEFARVWIQKELAEIGSPVTTRLLEIGVDALYTTSAMAFT